MKKIKVATLCLDGCFGCHVSFLDMDERILEIVDSIELNRSRLTDIKEFSPVDVGIVEGAVGNKEGEEFLKELRRNCKILVTFGDCACFGGTPSMRNSFNVKDVLSRCFIEAESVKEGKLPSFDIVPPLLEQSKPVNQLVKVDCYLPGCPPSADVIYFALTELLEGRIPTLPSEFLD